MEFSSKYMLAPHVVTKSNRSQNIAWMITAAFLSIVVALEKAFYKTGKPAGIFEKQTLQLPT